MNIAVISHAYPTETDPSRAVFIQEEARIVSTFSNLRVFIPSVYATPLNAQYHRNLQLVEENFPVSSFKYLSIPFRRLPFITEHSLSRKLLKQLQKHSVDIVHLHALFPVGIASKALKSAGYRVVITIHGGDWYSNLDRTNLMKRIHDSIQFADKIVAVGKLLSIDVQNRFPDIAHKVINIPHGIDTNYFKPPESKNLTKKELGWNNEYIHLLSVGNLYQVKGLHYLVKAFAKLPDRRKLLLHLVTPRAHQNAKKMVELIIKKHHLEQNITFYPSMTHKEIVKYYQAADLYISPSIKEGFGLAVAEAAACGTPVLATKSGGPEEIVTPDIGQLIPTKNTEKLTTGIQNMITNLSDYSPIKLNRFINSKFSLSQKKIRLEELYKTILE